MPPRAKRTIQASPKAPVMRCHRPAAAEVASCAVPARKAITSFGRAYRYCYTSELFPRCNESGTELPAARSETMSPDDEDGTGAPPDTLRVPGAAYLLSQVGAHSSQRWRER